MFGLQLKFAVFISFYFLTAVVTNPQRYYFPVGYQRSYLYLPAVYPINEQQIEPSYQPLGHFRSGLPYHEEAQSFFRGNTNPRFFHMSNTGSALITLTYSTSTTTKTNTITKFCTTSTAALVTCAPAGSRRRGMALNGLYHNEDDLPVQTQEIAFNPAVLGEPIVVATFHEGSDIIRAARDGDASVFLSASMSGDSNGRQLISFRLSTSTVTATATFTSVLMAICASTSGFPTCASG